MVVVSCKFKDLFNYFLSIRMNSILIDSNLVLILDIYVEYKLNENEASLFCSK